MYSAVSKMYSFQKYMKFKFLPSLNHKPFSSSFSYCNETSRAELLSKKLPKKRPIDGVKHILLVASGKGGVGKSTIAVNLAVALKIVEPDKEVGLLDADVFGPSIPLMMNLHETPLLNDGDQSTIYRSLTYQYNLMLPLINYGVKCMSMGNLITKNSAAIWRGLMVMSALDKLMRQVAWGPLDYMIVDTPPGTGDTHLSLTQNLPIAGAIIVSTGQKASLEVARRGVTMFEKLQIPVVGIVHNMSSVKCVNCSNLTTIFGNTVEEFSKENNIKILENILLEPTIIDCCDNGKPVVIAHPDSLQARVFLNLASQVSTFLKSATVT